MPTSTFFNLPPPKRERLLRAAMAEFVQKPFSEVSINRIIHGAQIPRGSFYQYFTDKADLFHYIMDYFGGQLKKMILSSVDACGGDLLSAPLALFDQAQSYFRENRLEFQVLTSIVRQNAGMDVGQLWDFMYAAQEVLDRGKLDRLIVSSKEAQFALLDLLMSSTAQALMAASCGKLTPEESRARLENKIRIIRQGAEIKEEPTC